MTNYVSINASKFDIKIGETILEAANRAKFPLPYSCRTGRCSTCKCRQLSGSSIALHEESGLSEEEKTSGWILGCVRTTTSELELEADEFGVLDLPPIVTLPSRIHEIDMLAPDVARVILRLPPSGSFTYLPGQYIDVIAHGGTRRSYSLANADAGKRLLELHIRRVQSGVMSEYWFERARPNDLLRLHGPQGTFFLREIESRDLVFLATGTGIAPVKAMLEGLRYATSHGQSRSISVYWGGRAPEDIYLDASLFDCSFVPVLSRGDDTWQGRRGHVQEAFLADRPDLNRTVVYACGSNEMVRGARKRLTDAGLSGANYFSDAFVCSAAGPIVERNN